MRTKSITVSLPINIINFINSIRWEEKKSRSEVVCSAIEEWADKRGLDYGKMAKADDINAE